MGDVGRGILKKAGNNRASSVLKMKPAARINETMQPEIG